MTPLRGLIQGATIKLVMTLHLAASQRNDDVSVSYPRDEIKVRVASRQSLNHLLKCIVKNEVGPASHSQSDLTQKISSEVEVMLPPRVNMDLEY